MKQIFVLLLFLAGWGLALADDEISFYEGPRNALSADDTQTGDSENYSRAALLFKQKKYEKARMLFGNEVHDHPTNARALYFLARCEQEKGDAFDSAVHYLISDRLRPSSVTHSAAQRALALLDEKQRVQAIQTAKQD